MKNKLRFLVLTFCILSLTSCTKKQKNGADEGANLGWPRVFAKHGNTIELFQPQVDSWKDYANIHFRMAVAVTPKNETQPIYGVVTVQGDSLVDHDAQMVLITNLDVVVGFPGLPDDKAAKMKHLVHELLPKKEYLNVPLNQVLACLHADQPPPMVAVNLNPPPIFFSSSPAILVIYMGAPQFKPVAGTKLMFAVNTNWPVFMDTATGQYYLLNGESWLTAPDPVKGPWAAVASFPADLLQLPQTSDWESVRKNIPGKPASSVPTVFVSTEPAELIVTNGEPEFTPVTGTNLMYVSNPVLPLFLDISNLQHYYLVAGRWFSAPSVKGPWAAASANLPAEFAKIPHDSPMSYVLASVPGTQQAKDAVLLASIPHKATVNIKEAKVDVVYEGPPKFVAIEGTTMQYAVNTTYQVVSANGNYYCCYQGVWFVAPAATGPWLVCTAVPGIIYTIPSTCPLYNVTYVRVYDATPSTVVVGYTSGYGGAYVATTGALMFGAGMVTGALIAGCGTWYPCAPCYYSYGCAANYHYAYGGFYRGGVGYYGPYGGAGWGAAYHPATGTWTRGAYAYGPYGAAGVRQAYNPFTNTFASHAGATNGYQSWGHGTVAHDGQWATGGHVSGPMGSRGYVADSSGQWAQAAHGAGGGTVARTSGGDVYAGRDGNVYRRNDSGQWQHYHYGGGWQNPNWSNAAYRQQLNQDSWARGRSGGFGGGYGGGFGGFHGGGFRR